MYIYYIEAEYHIVSVSFDFYDTFSGKACIFKYAFLKMFGKSLKIVCFLAFKLLFWTYFTKNVSVLVSLRYQYHFESISIILRNS